MKIKKIEDFPRSYLIEFLEIMRSDKERNKNKKRSENKEKKKHKAHDKSG